MSLFSSPEEHAANPPASWQTVKVAPKLWALQTADGGTLDTFPTKAKAEEAKVSGSAADLYAQESKWYQGEPVYGWKPYQAPVAS